MHAWPSCCSAWPQHKKTPEPVRTFIIIGSTCGSWIASTPSSSLMLLIPSMPLSAKACRAPRRKSGPSRCCRCCRPCWPAAAAAVSEAAAVSVSAAVARSAEGVAGSTRCRRSCSTTLNHWVSAPVGSVDSSTRQAAPTTCCALGQAPSENRPRRGSSRAHPPSAAAKS